MRPLDITIVTGMSGAGRSTAADVLEDLGYFVIDNLPPALMAKVAELGRGEDAPDRYVLGVDVRSGAFVEDLEAALRELRSMGASTRVVFLDANDDVLVRRYEATRRKHPFFDGERVSASIARERTLLEELKGRADIVIDTSELNVHELRDRLVHLFGGSQDDVTGLRVSVVSFGYKHGLPIDVDLVFDCRFLPNPHWVDELRPLTGDDEAVVAYVLEQPETASFLEQLRSMLAMLLPAYVREGKSYLSIGIGCTGGRHRSVVIASAVAGILEELGFPAVVQHRDVGRA
jgi:UPF0042 nucleotide-binding protein